MPVSGFHELAPGQLDQDILTWSWQQKLGCVTYDVEDDAECVVMITYGVTGVDIDDPFPVTMDWSEAFLRVLIATDTGRASGVLHQLVEMDLRRGLQFSAPAMQITIRGRYPKVAQPDGVEQPPLIIKASVGRGGHGCGCPTRTIPDPGGQNMARIPVMAYSAVLISPAAAVGARIQFYTANGILIANSPITPETAVEALVPQGAANFGLSGVGAGCKVSFKLAM